jgi:prostaglandin reductase 1
VIGCAGSDDKCKWLKDDLGFDSVFNYKTDNLEEALKKAAPKGIDCYFDNVGGDMSATVVEKFMNRFGRVSCCGALSAYNATTPPIGHHLFQSLVFKELKMQGFIVTSFTADAPAAAAELLQWVKEGKLKWREDVVDGFENARTALYGMLQGKYTGKVLVKAFK